MQKIKIWPPQIFQLTKLGLINWRKKLATTFSGILKSFQINHESLSASYVTCVQQVNCALMGN